MGQAVRIYLLDDQRLVRRAVHSLVVTSPDLIVVGESGELAEALADLCELLPDVVLLGSYGGKYYAPEPLGRIHSTAPGARILIVSDPLSVLELRTVLSSGADGGVSKDSQPWELFQAIRSALAGYSYLSASLVAPGLQGIGATTVQLG